MLYELKLKTKKLADNGEEKEVVERYITEANKLMQDYMRQGLDDMRLDAIQKTKIIDIL